MTLISDESYVYNEEMHSTFSVWKQSVLELLQEDKTLKLAIVEVGCGLRVPTVRMQSESFLHKTRPYQVIDHCV